MEGWRGIVFTVRYMLNQPGTHADNKGPLNIQDAFQGDVKLSASNESSSGTPMRYVGGRMSDSDDDQRRGPYHQTHQTPEFESSLPPTAFGPARYSIDEEGSRYPPEEGADALERRTAARRQQHKYETKHPR